VTVDVAVVCTAVPSPKSHAYPVGVMPGDGVQENETVLPEQMKAREVLAIVQLGLLTDTTILCVPTQPRIFVVVKVTV
jgi:hypothetical protein